MKVLDDSTGFMPRRADLKTPLLVLMGMVFVLAAMCAVNVATLLLLRAAGRVREISMRYALGAARSRIVSQLLVEGGVLGLCGAVAGVTLYSRRFPRAWIGGGIGARIGVLCGLFGAAVSTLLSALMLVAERYLPGCF